MICKYTRLENPAAFLHTTKTSVLSSSLNDEYAMKETKAKCTHILKDLTYGNLVICKFFGQLSREALECSCEKEVTKTLRNPLSTWGVQLSITSKILVKLPSLSEYQNLQRSSSVKQLYISMIPESYNFFTVLLMYLT